MRSRHLWQPSNQASACSDSVRTSVALRNSPSRGGSLRKTKKALSPTAAIATHRHNDALWKKESLSLKEWASSYGRVSRLLSCFQSYITLMKQLGQMLKDTASCVHCSTGFCLSSAF